MFTGAVWEFPFSLRQPLCLGGRGAAGALAAFLCRKEAELAGLMAQPPRKKRHPEQQLLQALLLSFPAWLHPGDPGFHRHSYRQ